MPRKSFAPSEGENNNQQKRNPHDRPVFRDSSGPAPAWDNVPAHILHTAVCLLTTQGASPTFGYTRNGKSLTFAVWYKGERDIQYLTSSQEVLDYTLFLAREWFRMSDDELAEYPLSLHLID